MSTNAPAPTPRISASDCDSTSPDGGSGTGVSEVSTTRCSRGSRRSRRSGRSAATGCRPGAVPPAPATVPPRARRRGAAASWSAPGDRGSTKKTVRSCRCTTVYCTRRTSAIASQEERAEHQHRRREADADDRDQRCAPAAARCCEPPCARAAEQAADAGALEPCWAIAAGRLGAHRLGRRQRTARRTAPERARQRRDQADHDSGHDDRRRQPRRSTGNWKNAVVEAGHRRAHPGARGRRRHGCRRRRSTQAPLEVVPADRAVAVAERLERRDLLALQRRRGAISTDVEQERGDAEEDRPGWRGPCSAAARARCEIASATSAVARRYAPKPP